MGKENVIYISSQNIQVLCGSADSNDMIKISHFETLELQEGSMINGVITDEADVKDVLTQIKESGILECTLVIDSGQILTKNVVVPFMNKKSLIQFTKDELSSIDGSYTDLIYDYSVLRTVSEDEKTGEILCCGVERKLVGSYIDVFESVGIKLQRIDISINAVHKLTQELPELEDKTYILAILDGNNVSSFLFEKNNYVFSNRSRLFSERGSDAFNIEMSGNISQLIQFSKSKHSEHAIETAYFCNLQEDEESSVFKQIEDSLHIKAQEFPLSTTIYVKDTDTKAEFVLHKYILPMGGLFRK